MGCAAPGNALYVQQKDHTFVDVAKSAGVRLTPGMGMGVAVGDYDNDGLPDIFITAEGRSTLLHNNGDGTFTDVTERAGLAAPGFAVSAVFFDYDGDGLPDLFVGEYLRGASRRTSRAGTSRTARASIAPPTCTTRCPAASTATMEMAPSPM